MMLQKMKTNKIKIIYFIGIIFVVSSFIFIKINLLKLANIFLLIGALFIIPYNWLFFIDIKKKREEWSSYWLVNFLGLIVVVILLFFALLIGIERK